MDEFKVPSVADVPRPSKPTKSFADSSSNVETPAEQSTEQASKPENPKKTQCPYIEPKWSSRPVEQYAFEVLKSGAIVEVVKDLQTKPYWIFGRLPENDIVMAHPTISRYHAILQYRPQQTPSEPDEAPPDDEKKLATEKSSVEQGWYIYDLGSTHGTFVNKMRIPPKTYVRVRAGHMVKLGGSTRNFILQGPDTDEEPESELSVTELKHLRKQQEEQKIKEAEMQEAAREREGISWGMSEDADEETDLSVNPFASTNNEELFLDDPKKTLRGFFEREGLDLEYKVEEMSASTFVCRVELPVDDSNGRPIVAEVCHKGKKKECVLQCALEACRILDRHGVLRQANHEPLKRRAPTTDSDDDDEFLDRTGDIERKKQRKANLNQTTALTYEDLIEQENQLIKKIEDVETSILKYQEQVKRVKESETKEDEDLDAFMTNLADDTKLDKIEIRRLRVEQQRLKFDHQKLQKLIKIAKPIDLPSIVGTQSSQQRKKSFLPLYGKRTTLKVNLPVTKKPSTAEVKESEFKSDEEEIEEFDEPEEPTKEPLKAEQKSPTKTEKKKTDSQEQDLQKKLIGPAFIPADILKPVEMKVTTETAQSSGSGKERPEISSSLTASDLPSPDVDDQEESTSSKKRRPRVRNRDRHRENIDIDDTDEFIDTTKYSGWVPPKNQSGDGITSLNKKFGY